MKVAEKLLTAIGLEPMTNKDVLLEAMAEMDGYQLQALLFSCTSTLERDLDEIMCSECKEKHGGRCSAGEDVVCVIQTGEWLDQPATETTATKIKEALA